MPSATPQRPRKLVARRCGACHEDFDTTRQKATRCPQCISEGLRVRYRNCFECKTAFVLFDEAHMNCPACAEALGIDQDELTPEQLEMHKEAERLSKFKEVHDRQLEWLTQRGKAQTVPFNHQPNQYDLTSLGLI